MEESAKYSIDLSFEEISLPPFNEVLIVGRDSAHGKHGISKSLEFLFPNGFEIIDMPENHKVEVILVSKRVLKKLPEQKLLKILEDNVFPYISDCEILKVDLKVRITFEQIEINPAV